MRYLIMCRSLTYAQRGARLLEKSGINAGILKAPKLAAGNGCGYCLSVSYVRGIAAAEILRRAGLLQGKIFEQSTDGTLKEVSL